MKKSLGISLALAALVIAYWNISGETQKSAKEEKESTPAEVASNVAPKSKVTAPKSKEEAPVASSRSHSLSAKTDLGENKKVRDLSRASDVQEAIESVDLWNPVELTELTKDLRSADAEMISNVFEESLETPSRARVLTVASETEGPHLSRFWQKVLETKVPTTLVVEGREEPNLFRNHEINLAIKGLRLIATEDLPARDYLERLILTRDMNQGEESIRRQAFLALREVDIVRASKILRQLDDSDVLNEVR